MDELDQTIEVQEISNGLMITISSSAVTIPTKYALAKCLSGDVNIFLPTYIAYGDGDSEHTPTSKTENTTSLDHEIASRCGLYSTSVTEETYTEDGVRKTGYYVSLIFVDDRSTAIKNICELAIFSSNLGGQCMTAASLANPISKDAGKTLMLEWRIRIR